MKNKKINKQKAGITVYPCTWDETGELIVFWEQELEYAEDD